MKIEELWIKVTKWLSKERIVVLPRGSDFKANYDKEIDSIEIIPIKTGIPRIVNKIEWEKFGKKFNQVKASGYDPFKPGHYARISFNSSYLVAILKKYGYSE